MTYLKQIPSLYKISAIILLAASLLAGIFIDPKWGGIISISGALWICFVSMPEVALAILISGFLLYPVFFEIAGFETTSLSSGVLFVLLSTGAMVGTFSQDPRRSLQRIRKPVPILFMAMIIYFGLNWLVLSENTSFAILKMEYTIIILLPSFLASLWFERRKIERLAWWIVVFSTLDALGAIIKRWIGLSNPHHRLSLGGNPIQFGNSVGIGGMLSWVLALKKSSRRLVWAIIFMFLTFVIIFASGTRGAMVVLITGLIIFFLITKRWRHVFWIFMPVSFVLAIWLTPYVTLADRAHSTDRIVGRFAVMIELIGDTALQQLVPGWNSQTENSEEMPTKDIQSAPLETLDTLGSGRVNLFLQSWRLWQKRPWFGIGYGNFLVTSKTGFHFHYSHNYILEVLCETGVLGILLFGSLLIMSITKMGQLLRRAPGIAEWTAIAITIYALLAGLLSYSISYFAMFWIGLGLVSSLDVSHAQKK